MARFFFHLHNGIGDVPDGEGCELSGLPAARAYAIKNIRSILCGDVVDGLIDLRGRIEIADAAGRVLAPVPFADAVELRLDDQVGTDPS